MSLHSSFTDSRETAFGVRAFPRFKDVLTLMATQHTACANELERLGTVQAELCVQHPNLSRDMR